LGLRLETNAPTALEELEVTRSHAQPVELLGRDMNLDACEGTPSQTREEHGYSLLIVFVMVDSIWVLTVISRKVAEMAGELLAVTRLGQDNSSVVMLCGGSVKASASILWFLRSSLDHLCIER
jgi:hypothetical protein